MGRHVLSSPVAVAPVKLRYLPTRAGLLATLTVASLAVVAALHGQEIGALGPLPASGRVSYFISHGAEGSGYRTGDDRLARWALDAWERASEHRIRFEPAAEDDALVRVYWVAAGAGQYGEMKSLRLKGVRGAAVFIRPDTSALGPDIAAGSASDPLLRDAIVYLTCLHELGHAVGLSHTAEFRDIMYSFGFGGDIPGFFGRYRRQLRTRDDIATVSGLSDADVARVRQLYAPAR